MKKLLVILMAAAGFVTTASADPTPFDCSTNPNNQCCIDVASIQSAIAGSTTSPQSITTADGYTVTSIDEILPQEWYPNPGNYGHCVDGVAYLDSGNSTTGRFNWVPGNWKYTIHSYSN